MFKRLIDLIKSWFGVGIDKLENPDVLLDTAKREMQEVHARNRERAVQAITAKNNLQQQVDDVQKQVDNLTAKAEFAVKRGDRDLALQLLKEKQSYEASLVTTKESLATAIEMSEQVKTHIKREEEMIRQKTAEALRLKAQWKGAQIANEMEKQLAGMTQFEDTESAFNRASVKIGNAMSESKARAELNKTNVGSRIQTLEVGEKNVAAENELAALEAKLGMGSTTATTQTTVVSNDIEKELAALEAKVGGSGGSSN